jgi:PadR family transcriptional regulator PadR
MLRAFFLGFIQIHILHHAIQEPIYGSAMIVELKRHGYDLSPGTLYPILHTMEKAGYLSVNQRIVEGKIRKYYRATETGQHALEELLPKLRELVSEVLEEPHLSVQIAQEETLQERERDSLQEERTKDGDQSFPE